MHGRNIKGDIYVEPSVGIIDSKNKIT